jgi:hypothetical protein
MKRIDARFDQPSRPGRAAWLMVAALAVAAVGACAWAWAARADLMAAQARLTDLTRVQQETADAETKRPAVVPPYDSSARQMLKERLTPWPAALTAIENVAMAGVTVTSIEASASEGKVLLEVNFSDHAKLLEYVDALNAGLEPSVEGWRWAIRQTQLNTNSAGQGAPGSARLDGAWH